MLNDMLLVLSHISLIHRMLPRSLPLHFQMAEGSPECADFVEALVFSPNEAVVMTADRCDAPTSSQERAKVHVVVCWLSDAVVGEEVQRVRGDGVGEMVCMQLVLRSMSLSLHLVNAILSFRRRRGEFPSASCGPR